MLRRVDHHLPQPKNSAVRVYRTTTRMTMADAIHTKLEFKGLSVAEIVVFLSEIVASLRRHAR